MKKKDTIYILSIDGGGIRGIIPAVFLHYVHERLRKSFPASNVYDFFDLIAGTSTGGLIALGLSTPIIDSGKTRTPKYSTDAMIKLYTNKGPDIFRKTGSRLTSYLAGLMQHKYRTEFLDSLMEELFGKSTLSKALNPVIVTAYDAEHMTPHIFRSHQPAREPNPHTDFYIKDAARCTSAAPVYFPPAKIYSVPDEKKYGLIDGGVFANNPALVALVEAKRLFPEAKKFSILSVGTGSAKSGYDIENMLRWGAYQWMSPGNKVPILQIMMTGQAETVDHTIRAMKEVEYHRFTIQISSGREAMDDVSPESISYLKSMGAKLVSDNLDRVESVLHTLKKKMNYELQSEK